MDELGLDRAMLWPTLARVLEERLADDPVATHAAIHAYNEWMLDPWSFNVQDRISPVPVITLRRLYARSPGLFEEDAVAAFKRCVWVHPFHEEDPVGLAELVSIDNVCFGSDYPHPEGLWTRSKACRSPTRPRSWAAISRGS